MDRSRIGQKRLYFEQDFNKNEDYDFVIRICAKFPSDFTLVPRTIGDYYLKADGNNSILTEYASTAENNAGWPAADDSDLGHPNWCVARPHESCWQGRAKTGQCHPPAPRSGRYAG